MSPFHNPFGKSIKNDGDKKDIQSDNLKTENSRDMKFEQQLKSEFGLTLGKEGWLFQGGRIIDDLKAVNEPRLFLAFLNNIRKRNPIEFNQAWIIESNKMIVFACNTKPHPICVASGLNPSTMSDLIVLATEEGDLIRTYQSAKLLIFKAN
jgi:hypothetical protein